MEKKGERWAGYGGIVIAIIAYYLIHEGAHLLCALLMGAWKGIHCLGIGIQIDIFADRLSDGQMGLFCAAGSIATLLCGYLFVGLRQRMASAQRRFTRLTGWYSTLTLLMLDPIYLSVLYRAVGGGDMNGIRLLVSEPIAVCVYALIGVINALIIYKLVYPCYKSSSNSKP